MSGRPSKANKDTFEKILSDMCRGVSLSRAARHAGLSEPSIHAYRNKSIAAEKAGDKPPEYFFAWLDDEPSYFHKHLDAARAIAISSIDGAVIESALVPQMVVQRNMQTGEPFYEADPLIAAHARDLDDDMWDIMYAPRKRSDHFKRDENGALIPVVKEVRDTKLLIKAAESLLASVYGQRIQHSVAVGGVLRVTQEMHEQHRIINGEFKEALPAPTNVLAVGEKYKDAKAWEETYGGKRLVDAVLFFDEEGNLEPPLATIAIAQGSSIDKAYIDAGIEHNAVPPQELIAQGYQNSWLLKLVPP